MPDVLQRGDRTAGPSPLEGLYDYPPQVGLPIGPVEGCNTSRGASSLHSRGQGPLCRANTTSRGPLLPLEDESFSTGSEGGSRKWPRVHAEICEWLRRLLLSISCAATIRVQPDGRDGLPYVTVRNRRIPPQASKCPGWSSVCDRSNTQDRPLLDGINSR